MIFQIDTTAVSSATLFSSFALEWIIGTILTIIGLLIAILFYIIPARKAKKEAKQKQQKYYKHGGWIKASDLEYSDLDKKREKQKELQPSTHELVFKGVTDFLNTNSKTKNILLKGPSLSGKSHLSVRFINQLNDAYILLPTHELLEKTDDIEQLFPKTPKKAKIKVVLVDDLQEFIAKGKNISDTILHFLNTNHCIVWFNYVSYWGSNSEISDIGFKQIDAFKTFEIEKLGGNEIRTLKKQQIENNEFDSDGTIGSLFYSLQWMERRYGELTLLSKSVISIIKQAYMLGFHEEGFVMPYEIIYKYFQVEYDAPDNTKSKLDEVLSELENISFINNVIAHTSFVLEPAYLDNVIEPSLEYDTFISSWNDKQLLRAGNWFYVGVYYSLEKLDFNKAVIYYKKTLSLNPEISEANNNLGIAYHKLKQYDQALKYYSQTALQKPQSPEIYTNIAITYNSLGDYDRAIKNLNKSINIDNNFFMAWLNLGIINHDFNKYDKAVESYKKAIAINPNSQDAHFNLGVTYDNSGEYGKAVESYKKAIDIDPYDQSTYFNLGIAYDNCDEYKKAVVSYEKAIEIDNTHLDSWINLGISLGRLEMFTEAIKTFNTAITIKPDSYKSWTNLGYAYSQLGEYSIALEKLEKAISIKSDFYYPYHIKGMIYTSQKKYIEAIESYTLAIKIKSDESDSWNGLGIVYAEIKEYNKAIDCFNKAIKLDPLFAGGWKNVGHAYNLIGNSQKAQKCFDKHDEILKNFEENKSTP